MKILLLPAYFHPEQAASPYLGENRNQAFADAGYNMVVYTPIPTRGITEDVRDEYKNKKYETLFDGKMIVHRFNLIWEKKNPVLRAWRYTMSCIKQFCKGVFAKDACSCDLMFISSTPPIQGAMAALVKKCRRDHIPLIYNRSSIIIKIYFQILSLEQVSLRKMVCYGK